ncbi:hypothetical protein [Spirosoma flavum]|uniref:J domain-containing protein n=1 Tax=Spirosoma flavum TaxID=2048557 RepID=A0ABW6AF56_9BACT
MTQLTQQHVVRIGTGKQNAVLSKSQKEFNRLTLKIEKTGADLHNLREAAHYIHQRMQTDYRPLVEQYCHFRADLVRLFDRAYDSKDYTKTEKKKLADLIRNIAFDLISGHDIVSLKPIYDKYDAVGFDNANDEADQQTEELMKEMMGTVFGIDFNEDVDVSDPQKMTDYVQEQIDRQEAAEAHRQQQRANKPKSAKQQEREAKKQAEERNSTKAVRTLYMDLVKAFHPDREPDEAEKVRKTEIMHRVIAAYEKSDILALFRLQLEFERIDQTHLETLAEDQLKYYNKILRQQAQELDDEFLGLQNELAAMTGKPAFTVNSKIGMEFSLNSDIAQLKRDIKYLKADVKALADTGLLKHWLRTYQIEKSDDF